MAGHGGPDLVQDGLVLSLDAADKNSYPGSGTTWYDLSPTNDNDGTLTLGPTFQSTGGGSIGFDGVNDYVIVGTSMGNLGTTSATFSTWVFRDNSDGYDYFFDARAGSGAGYTQGAGGSNGINKSSGTSYVDGVASSTLVAGEWHNLTITGMTIYPQTSFLIGAYNAALTLHAHVGNIATVHVWNRVLSVKELQQNFNAQRSRFGV